MSDNPFRAPESATSETPRGIWSSITYAIGREPVWVLGMAMMFALVSRALELFPAALGTASRVFASLIVMMLLIPLTLIAMQAFDRALSGKPIVASELLERSFRVDMLLIYALSSVLSSAFLACCFFPGTILLVFVQFLAAAMVLEGLSPGQAFTRTGALMTVRVHGRVTRTRLLLLGLAFGALMWLEVCAASGPVLAVIWPALDFARPEDWVDQVERMQSRPKVQGAALLGMALTFPIDVISTLLADCGAVVVLREAMRED